ncbi:MAG: hypothetical protein DLM64_04270 [Solirubrobacterales bacterium]|nr:MAG: hypothetical protein DLM64_04270 [Solirubrobacterales bacterium]
MSARGARAGAEALRVTLRDLGGALADAVAERPAPLGAGDAPGPAQIAAGGPRAAGMEAEYELLLEMILEGSRLHYGRPLTVRPGDPDLALLLGDQLYAFGLSRLAAIGDLAAISELADVISLLAQAHAGANDDLARAVWEAGAVAIGWGASAGHDAAKALARTEDPRADAALARAAANVAATVTVEPTS